MVKFDDADGVWRTVGGRRIFIKNGQDLASAMKESGKFKKGTYGGKDDLKKKYVHAFPYHEKTEEEKEYLKETQEYFKDKDVKAMVEQAKADFEKENNIKITDREIRQLKTQKGLKDLVETGRAKDITTWGDDKSRELQKQHGRLEVIKVTKGTYGMNGALLQSRETGEYFVITSRNSNLFYWV